MTHHSNPNPNNGFRYDPSLGWVPDPPKNTEPPKWFKIGLLVVIGLVILGACGAIFGGDSEDEAPSVSSPKVVENVEGAAPEAAPVLPAAPAAEAPAPAPKEASGVGAVVRDGKLEFSVDSWDGISSVGVTVTNIGNSPKYVFSENIELVDTQGRTFTPESDWTSDLWLTELQPGQSASGYANYSLSGAQPSHLLLKDSIFSRGTKVNLN